MHMWATRGRWVKLLPHLQAYSVKCIPSGMDYEVIKIILRVEYTELLTNGHLQQHAQGILYGSDDLWIETWKYYSCTWITTNTELPGQLDQIALNICHSRDESMSLWPQFVQLLFKHNMMSQKWAVIRPIQESLECQSTSRYGIILLHWGINNHGIQILFAMAKLVKHNAM